MTRNGRCRNLGLFPLWVGLADVVLIHVGFLAAFALRFAGEFPRENFEAYLQAAPGLTILALVLFLTYGLYDFRPQSWRTVWSGLVAALTLFPVCGMALSFVARAFALPRTVVLLSWFLHLLFSLGWRYAVWRTVEAARGALATLIVGPGSEALRLAGMLSGSGQGYQVVGLVLTDSVAAKVAASANEPTQAQKHPELSVISLDSLVPMDGTHRTGWTGFESADVLIMTPSTSAEDRAAAVTLASRLGAQTLLIPAHKDLLTLDSRVMQIDDTLVFEVGPDAIPPHLAWAKRALDIAVALMALVLSLPLCFVIALAIKLSSPGPIFYSQTRVGLHGRPYNLLKFRTMIDGAEERSGPVLCNRDDSRVTGVGRVLRTYRLDELPQFLNVLLGSMSLVGPRPERPEFVGEYCRLIPSYEQRHLLKPGLTGLAQLHARYDTPVEEKLRYDLLYAKRYSLFLDLRILFLTAKVLLMGDEAQWQRE